MKNVHTLRFCVFWYIFLIWFVNQENYNEKWWQAHVWVCTCLSSLEKCNSHRQWDGTIVILPNIFMRSHVRSGEWILLKAPVVLPEYNCEIQIVSANSKIIEHLNFNSVEIVGKNDISVFYASRA